MMRLDAHIIFDFDHLMLSFAAKNFSHQRFIIRRQMLDHHEAMREICRNPREQLLNRVKSPRRGPHTDNVESFIYLTDFALRIFDRRRKRRDVIFCHGLR